MRLLCQLLLFGVLFNNSAHSQLPNSLLGSYKVISNSGLDELVFEKERVVGKVDDKSVVEYLFEKKENEYYYFKIRPLNQIVPQQMESHVYDERKKEEDRNTNVYSRTSKKTPLKSPNSKGSQNVEELSVKAKVEALEDGRIKLDIKYLDENNEILQSHTLVMEKINIENNN